MQKILNKRIIRDIKENCIRYIALFLLIVLGMYMIISIVGAAQSVITSVHDAGIRNHVEDGHFGVFVPLEEDYIKLLTNKGIEVENTFYLDYKVEDGSILRIYKNRKNINLIDLEQGELAKSSDEIVLEKHYAYHHNLTIGSSILIGNKEFFITGICSVPDYDAALKNLSDSSVESNLFGLGFLTDDSYERLNSKNTSEKAEEYSYSYRLNGQMTSEELKDYLSNTTLDRNKVADTYFQEMLNRLEDTKNEIDDGINKLKDGTEALTEGLNDLSGKNEEINQALDRMFQLLLYQTSDKLKDSEIDIVLTEENYTSELSELLNKAGDSDLYIKETIYSLMDQLSQWKEFKEGINQYTESTKAASKGSEELQEGVMKLKEKTDDFLTEYFDTDLKNLTGFITKEDNRRIAASAEDVQINKLVGMIAGVIVLSLFSYVISVFVIHGIDQESVIIGALYALGVSKRQLLRHYLKLPVLITFVSGIVGTVIGFSPWGIGVQLTDASNYFSLPLIKTAMPPYLILYGIIAPPLIAIIVNYIVINKKLSEAPLKLIRNEKTQSNFRTVNLGKLSFLPRFQIRQFLREIRTSLTVVLGMFISLLILMLGVNCYTICHNLSVQNKKDTTYQYMYTYKYPTKEIPEGGEACYLESLKKEVFGYPLDVALLGIDKENPYFNYKVPSSKNKVVVSKSFATKFNISVSDTIILEDDVNDMYYAFTVDDIVPYSVGLYVFMDIGSMRELFGQEEGYYNTIFSDKSLAIDSGRLYTTTTKADIEKSAEVFLENMWPLITSMISISILIFIIVMYLMMKVMIDRSTYHISLMKIFGYQNKEIRKLYLDGNFIMISLSAVICIPLAKLAMDTIYPYFVSNVAVGIDLSLSPQTCVAIYLGILICYLAINTLLVRRLKKMLPAEVLKNRE